MLEGVKNIPKVNSEVLSYWEDYVKRNPQKANATQTAIDSYNQSEDALFLYIMYIGTI
jgi:hypothetical protein